MNDVVASLFSSIVPIFVLIMIGYGLRRLNAVGHAGTEFLTRLVIYGLFPVLVFHRLAVTDDPAMLLQDPMIHAWAVVVLFGSGLVGLLVHRLSRTSADPRTFVFSVAMPNWIFLPLAIAGPLWGDEAVRLIILFNIPTQFILWTAGIWILHGSVRGMGGLHRLLMNPGLIATAAGVLTAFRIIPLDFLSGREGIDVSALSPVLHLVGNVTIPLSIIALGLYLGEGVADRPGARREVVVVTIGRLIVAPLLVGLLIPAAELAGIHTPPLTRWVLYLIICMPLAMSVPVFVRLFGGDRYLASRAVVVSTVAGLFTAPLLVIAALKLEVLLGIAGR